MEHGFSIIVKSVKQRVHLLSQVMDGVDTSTLCGFVQGILSILEVGMHECMTVWQPDICRLTLVQFLKKGHSGYSGYMYSMQSGE